MQRPNILFLLSDEHSFRFLGTLARKPEGEPVVTPTLDRLVAQGTHFTDAYCQMPLCTPSRISLLTGLEPRHCGAWANESVLRPELPTIASLLGAAGYRSALIGKMHLGGTAQFAGFQDRPYGDLTGKTGHQQDPIDGGTEPVMRTRTADAGVTEIPESLLQEQVVAQETVAWVRESEARAPEEPWFVCSSFSRPHFPLTAPRRWIEYYRKSGITEPKIPAAGDAYDHPMSRGMRAGFHVDAIDHQEMMEARLAYFACVSYFDEIIGDLLDRLESSGSLKNTVIVYTTDHGEMAGEHGVWWKNGWYEGCARVPLIVSTPAQRAGGSVKIGSTGNGGPVPSDPPKPPAPATRCTTPVGLTDLLPTLCTFAGARVPDAVAGRDLGPAIGRPSIGRPAGSGEGSEPYDTSAAIPAVPVTCDALTPRWGEGTEFRMVRLGSLKYVRFRNAPPLAFDLAADPGEQRNLLAHDDLSGETATALAELRAFADESLDFDQAERERTERDGSLRDDYRLDLPPVSGNLYIFPSGELVNADDPVIYDRTVLATSAEDLFSRE